MDNKQAKPPMTAIVSAAQKSINSNSNKASTIDIKSTAVEKKSESKILNATVTAIKSEDTKATPVKSEIPKVVFKAAPQKPATVKKSVTKAPVTKLVSPKSTAKPATTQKAPAAKSVTKPATPKSTAKPATTQKAPAAKSVTKPATPKSTAKPATTQKAPVAKSVTKPATNQKVTPTAIKSKPINTKPISVNKNPTHDIVQVLCTAIENVHNKTLDFSDQLRQRRLDKEETLSKIQIKACDNINAVSSACIEAAKKTLKSKNPMEILESQTKIATEMQKIYSDMLTHISDASMNLLKYNASFDFKKSQKK